MKVFYRILSIHFKTIGAKDEKVINTHSARSIYGFAWVQDSRRMLFLQDQAGNGNYHIYLADSATPDRKPVDLTPFDETRAWIHQILRSDAEHILVGHDRRDKSVDDLYRLNLNTGEQDLLAQKLRFFNKEVEALSEPFRTRQPVNLSLTSSNNKY